MVRAASWHVLRQLLNPAGRRGERRWDRRLQSYRPWPETLEERLAPAVTLSISNPMPFPKPDTGQMMGLFVVTRSGDLAPAVQVHYQTQDGTGTDGAHAGVDYVATSGTLRFAANQTMATITVPIIGNNIFQAEKTFTVSLSNPQSSAADFNPQQTFAASGFPDAVAVGDFNGDGRSDLAIVNVGANTVSVLLNTTTAGATALSFAPQQTFAVGNLPFKVAVGDFNGDGKPDLVVTNADDDTVSVLLNTTAAGATTPSFAPQQTFATGGFPDGVAVGDFNGDGKPDLVVANRLDDTVSVLLNTTAMGATIPSFAPRQTFAAGAEPSPVAVGDFNGDGKSDLAIVNESANTVSVLLNTTPAGATAPSFAGQQTFATGTTPGSVAVGDFNGDGIPDLAIIDQHDDTASVLLNTTPAGATTPSFAPRQTFPTGHSPGPVVVGDFNGDGSPDLAVVNESASTVSVLLNTTPAGATTPGFAGQQTFATGTGPASVAVGDFNGDGSPDLAVANDPSNTVSVLLNAPVTITGNPATGTISSAPESPTAVTVVIGSTPQSATVNTAYVTALAVDVRDASGALVQGVTVTFTAPAGGASGTFGGNTSVMVVTDASGRATAPTFTADTKAGAYMVMAQAAGGSTPSARFSLTNIPGAAGHFQVSTTAANPQAAGVPFGIIVTAQDQYGNLATGYTGTVHFRSADPHPAMLPADYTFQTSDQGSHNFVNGATLFTAGTWDITAIDTTSGVTGTALILAIAPTTTVLVSSLNPALPGQSVTLTATVRTTVPGGGVPVGAVTFFDGATTLGTVSLSNGSATLTTAALSIGPHALKAAYNGSTQGGAPFAASTSAPLVQTIRSRYFAVAGAPGLVQIRRDNDGSLITEFAPYGSGYTGPIRVAVGDVSGDGIPDLVTGAGVGNPDVRVFNGAALENGTFNPANPGASLLAQWFAYGLNFNVGVNVAVGDVEKDGFADVVTGATVGNPDVRVYSGKDIANHTFNPNGSSVVAQWFAYGVNFNVGVNVAVGDVNADGYADVVTGASAGNPHVKVYSGKDIALHTFDPNGGSVLAQWFAFGLQFNIGAFVAVGDTNGDGLGDVIVGATSGNPQVKVYDGKAIANGSFQPANPDNSLLDQFFAFNSLGANVGVSVAAADFEGTGMFDILTGSTQGPGHYRVVKGNATGILPPAVNGIDVVVTDLTGGLFVGA